MITFYRSTNYSFFRSFADLLKKYKTEIINSFIIIQKYDSDDPQAFKRLSSGAIEAFNRKPKDMQRNGRGYRNFTHMRNRLLFATRDNPPILGVPKRPQLHWYKTWALQEKIEQNQLSLSAEMACVPKQNTCHFLLIINFLISNPTIKFDHQRI